MGLAWAKVKMNSTLHVTKRDGVRAPLDLDKIHKVLTWAAEGLDNVSVSEVELRAQIQLPDGISTSDIHETLIKSAADLISEQTPDYQYMAARLNIFHLRKKAFGQFEPPKLYDHVARLVDNERYDQHLLTDYTLAEFEEMEAFIDHGRDLNFAYAAVKQLEGKYLVQNRVTGEVFESPQFLYVLIGACLFSSYDQSNRMDYIRRFYDAVSTFKLSLPTPIMAGVRTPTRQFSSCVLIEAGDSLDSINAATSAIVKYVSKLSSARTIMSDSSSSSSKLFNAPRLNAASVHSAISPSLSFTSFKGFVGSAISKHRLDWRIGASSELNGLCVLQ